MHPYVRVLPRVVNRLHKPNNLALAQDRSRLARLTKAIVSVSWGTLYQGLDIPLIEIVDSVKYSSIGGVKFGDNHRQ